MSVKGILAPAAVVIASLVSAGVTQPSFAAGGIFGSFLLGGYRILQEFGFGLGFAVLADALLIRSLLVPAIMHLTGPANWALPGWLDRILPRVAIEAAEQAPVTGPDADRDPAEARSDREGDPLAPPRNSSPVARPADSDHPAHPAGKVTRHFSRHPEPTVILDLVLISLAITLEPLPLTAFLLVLASERGVRKGAAFVFGWFLSLAIHAVFRPERSHALLARMKTWIDTHTDRVIIIVSVLLGIWLIGKSSYLLAT